MTKNNTIELRSQEALPRKELLTLYDAVGWRIYTEDPVRLEKALAHSDYVVTAWEADSLVGLARCISDDVAIVYLQDILVLPSFQGRGIGRDLVNNCLERYSHVRQKMLLTDNRPEQIGFYSSLGFRNTRDLTETPLNAFVRIEGVELK